VEIWRTNPDNDMVTRASFAALLHTKKAFIERHNVWRKSSVCLEFWFYIRKS